MAFDFKKEYKDLYLPKAKPAAIEVPEMSFIAVAGRGNPNRQDGEYARAMALLYTLSYTIKMSKMGPWQPEGYFDYTVPPLEGLWWADSGVFDGSRIVDKDALSWVSLIRQPDFVTPDVFAWACEVASAKKPELAGALAAGAARPVCFSEGLCVQVMHRGSYDDEPATIERLSSFAAAEGYAGDMVAVGDGFTGKAALAALDVDGAVPAVRFHHEIYLGDPRRTKPENLKTVIRHPVRTGGCA